MFPSIKHTGTVKDKDNIAVLGNKKTKWGNYIKGLSKDELSYIKSRLGESQLIHLNRYSHHIFLIIKEDKYKDYQDKEELRKAGANLRAMLKHYQFKSITLIDADDNIDNLEAFAEGLALSAYNFDKYKTGKDGKEKKSSPFNIININTDKKNKQRLEYLQNVLEATCAARDLVNEPLSYLTAEQLGKEVQRLGKLAGFKTEILNKEKIKALKMGGLLAVNLGSINPPTFSIMEWKPAKAKNKKPIILVGKGVVYDTGGLSLKPTPNSMDLMKSDMGGAAAVIGTMYAVAKSKLPLHVIGLVPATENRPGGNAYVPGDVIKMHNGMTVEVLNTDAEGRMILADALSYAKKYDPELVIDLATLTGAAQRAIGAEGIVFMGTADEKAKKELAESGFNTYERLVEFPFWKEYGDHIKSDIADIKNIGGPTAGAITAGKFLEHFTGYPWLHLDIAGSAFLTSNDGYRGKNGTGVGVRLLFDYFKRKSAS